MNQDRSEEEIITVESLLRQVPAVMETTICRGVLDVFHKDKNLYSIPVVNNKVRPVGMVVRQEITDMFSKPFYLDIQGDKPISELMNRQPIIVDIDTAIEDVARIILNAGIQYMVTGFIVTRDGKCVGTGNGYDLLHVMMENREKHLFGLAHFDQLTGLPNRRLLRDRLEKEISVSTRSHQQISLLFVDLDGFKPVNDGFGHDVGDKVLKEVARRLQACIREGDTAARIGGDEFVVSLHESNLERAVNVANRILETLRHPYELPGGEISTISASIGIAEYPLHANNVEDFLVAADQAMYAAKRNGKNQFAIFDPEQHCRKVGDSH
jgi:diguanylate cyclase (GGDEF)-like protein